MDGTATTLVLIYDSTFVTNYLQRLLRAAFDRNAAGNRTLIRTVHKPVAHRHRIRQPSIH